MHRQPDKWKGDAWRKLLASAFLCLVAIAAANTPATSQSERPAGSESYPFQVQSQLVEIFLTVTKGKQLVPNLKISDFRLTEDGLPVPIDRLDNQDVPLQIALLFDVSGSIKESLHTIQDAADAFLQSLNPKDRVMLVLFGSEIRISNQSTDDRRPILKEIRNAQAGGITKLYEALLIGMKHLDGKPGRKAIVCFTDGQDTSGEYSRSTVLNAAARFGYPIYTIGTGAGAELATAGMILRELAGINSGKAFFIQDLRKLREAFLEVAAELHSAYVLNYYTQVPPDGQWHDIVISATDPACKIHTRKGFFARSMGQKNLP